MKYKLNQYLLVVFLTIFTTGCVTPSGTSDIWISEGKDLTQYSAVEVLPVIDSTGMTHEINVSALLTQHFKEQFESIGYLHDSKDENSAAVLTFKPDLVGYGAGSALGRWAAPGAGKARCVVRSALIDKQSGQAIGEILTIKEVSAGGLYSVGAEKYILEAVAADIADKLSTYLRGEEVQ
ncbi:MAG: hypothetical protein ACR2QW_06745 [bacterium]